MHGRNDFVVNFEGGGNDPNFKWLSFEETLENWALANECQNKSTTTNNGIDEIKFETCLAKTEGYIYNNGSHNWPNWRLVDFWNSNPSGSQKILDFFSSLN